MKKLTSLFLSIILVGITFIMSCSKSSDTTTNGPVIHFVAGAGYTSGDQTVQITTPLKFGITATAGDSKLKRFFVQRTFKGKTTTEKDSSFSANAFNYDLYTSAQGADGQESWVFTIFDNNGGSAAVSLIITTTLPAASGPIFTYTTKILGAQTNNLGSSFASANGTVYKLDAAKINCATVDWVYFYGAVNLATLCAPSDPNAASVYNDPTNGVGTWSVRNATVFKEVTDAINWPNITNDSIIVVQNQSGVTLPFINNLSIGKILAFKTAAGKKGMIQVTALTPDATGTITINVKVQQ